MQGVSAAPFRPEQHPRAAGGTGTGGQFVTAARREPDVRLDHVPTQAPSPTAQELEFIGVLDRHAHGLISDHDAWTEAKGLTMDEMAPAIAEAQAAAVRQGARAVHDVYAALRSRDKVDHLVALAGWRHPSDTSVEGSSARLRDALVAARVDYPPQWTEETVDDVVAVLLSNGFVTRKVSAA